MAVNEQLNKRVRAALAQVSGVEEKRMFRGTAFMVDGKMCVCVGDDELMCRIDPGQHDRLLAAGGCRTKVMNGRAYKGYIVVKEEGLGDDHRLDYWIKLSLAYNKVAKASRKKRKD